MQTKVYSMLRRLGFATYVNKQVQYAKFVLFIQQKVNLSYTTMVLHKILDFVIPYESKNQLLVY